MKVKLNFIKAGVQYMTNETFCRQQSTNAMSTGVVVPEHAGTPFRQIFSSLNGTPVHTVYQRWNADTAAFWQISSYY